MLLIHARTMEAAAILTIHFFVVVAKAGLELYVKVSYARGKCMHMDLGQGTSKIVGLRFVTCATIHPRKLIQLPKTKHLRKK